MAEILLISDLLDMRAKKIKELEFYTEELEKLHDKMKYLQAEISLTNKIIDMIHKEMVIEVKKQ